MIRTMSREAVESTVGTFYRVVRNMNSTKGRATGFIHDKGFTIQVSCSHVEILPRKWHIVRVVEKRSKGA